MTAARLSYEDSCRKLSAYLDGAVPPLMDHLPRHDDDELGVSFFRTFVGEGHDLSNLHLPHTFFGRSEVNDAAFRNTDFTESNLCWNDFVTDLRRADLRRSSFADCTFEGALMAGEADA